MSTEFSKIIKTAFSDEVVAHLVRALKNSYDKACEDHETDRGSNNRTFGYGLYNFAVHNICTEAEKCTEIKIATREPTFRFRVGEFDLCCHRVGKNGSEDIKESFPNNDGAVIEMIEESTGWLPGMEQECRSRKLVLGHMGNPEDGICAVYVCVPKRAESGHIVEWGETEPLWKKEESPVVAAVHGPTVPEEETVTDIPLRLKPDEDETKDNG